MAEKLLTLNYDLDGTPVTITVERATVRVGIQRYQLMIAAEEQNKLEPDPVLAPIRLFTFPSIVASTTKVIGLPWPMTFEEFVELPEDLVNRWNENIDKVNPQWRGRAEPEAEQTKKPNASANTSATTSKSGKTPQK
jgi:hypothetical protein